MFEKEAEEFAIENWEYYEEGKNDSKALKQAYQKGAEFGYNKAKVEVEDSYRESLCNSGLNLASVTEQLEELEKSNEWHYMKDEDLPKVGQKCYFIYSNFYGEDNKVIFSESSIKVITGVYTFILDEETGEETTETCFYDDINDEEIYKQEVYAWKEIVLPKEIKEND